MLFVYMFALLNACCLAINDVSNMAASQELDTEIGMDIECTDVWCEQYSYTDMENMYKGLFMTKVEFFIQQLLYHLDRDIILYHEGVKDLEYIVGSKGDGDSCCVTELETHINSTLRGIDGDPRNVVQLTKLHKYQFISQASCIGVGECRGLCVLEYTIRNVLVYSIPERRAWFDKVLVPTYCSCKRTDGLH